MGDDSRALPRGQGGRGPPSPTCRGSACRLGSPRCTPAAEACLSHGETEAQRGGKLARPPPRLIGGPPRCHLPPETQCQVPEGSAPWGGNRRAGTTDALGHGARGSGRQPRKPSPTRRWGHERHMRDAHVGSMSPIGETEASTGGWGWPRLGPEPTRLRAWRAASKPLGLVLLLSPWAARSSDVAVATGALSCVLWVLQASSSAQRGPCTPEPWYSPLETGMGPWPHGVTQTPGLRGISGSELPACTRPPPPVPRPPPARRPGRWDPAAV